MCASAHYIGDAILIQRLVDYKYIDTRELCSN